MQKLTKIWVITLVIAIILIAISFALIASSNCAENLTTGQDVCAPPELAASLFYASLVFFIIWVIESVVLIAKKCCKKK